MIEFYYMNSNFVNDDVRLCDDALEGFFQTLT